MTESARNYVASFSVRADETGKPKSPRHTSATGNFGSFNCYECNAMITMQEAFRQPMAVSSAVVFCPTCAARVSKSYGINLAPFAMNPSEKLDLVLTTQGTENAVTLESVGLTERELVMFYGAQNPEPAEIVEEEVEYDVE